jgi:hypothetical protein
MQDTQSYPWFKAISSKGLTIKCRVYYGNSKDGGVLEYRSDGVLEALR